MLNISNSVSNYDLVALLLLEGTQAIALQSTANAVRQTNVGDEILLRGLIEFSNYCTQACNYCGIRAANTNIQRYRMTADDIIETCSQAPNPPLSTVVLQSGEDPFFTRKAMGDIIKKIKAKTNQIITLSAGERCVEDYAYWKECGLNRYLLRFETSNETLFEACHPNDNFKKRLKRITDLQSLGIETGSGFLIGLPGQTIEQLANDLLFCTNLELDMIGVGPFIAHTQTPFAQRKNAFNVEVYFNTIALLRLLNPTLNIPATTAFDAIQPTGRLKALQAGANVLMPNITPTQYREHYQLYPGKPGVTQTAVDSIEYAQSLIHQLNRI